MRIIGEIKLCSVYNQRVILLPHSGLEKGVGNMVWWETLAICRARKLISIQQLPCRNFKIKKTSWTTPAFLFYFTFKGNQTLDISDTTSLFCHSDQKLCPSKNENTSQPMPLKLRKIYPSKAKYIKVKVRYPRGCFDVRVITLLHKVKHVLLTI